MVSLDANWLHDEVPGGGQGPECKPCVRPPIADISGFPAHTAFEYDAASMPKSTLPLPRDWPRHARSALLHAISLARTALIDLWSGFENGPLVCARQAARIARLESRVALLEEELRIKDARLARIPPQKRPHYPPCERFAILALRAAAGWNTAQTARRFQLTDATIAAWTKRLDEDGPESLVQTRTPVNRFPDFVRTLVAGLKSSLPGMGRRRIAAVLARAGLHLGSTTIRRMLERTDTAPPPPPPARETKPIDAASSPPRVVTARSPHHVWHVDITIVPTAFGFWVPWLPFALCQRWPFCFWVATVLDHSSRAVLGMTVVEQEPTADDVCTMLDHAVARAGRPPRHIISDRGVQFRTRYLEWCRTNHARPRFGAIGKSGSIAVIERFFRSLKYEYLRRILVPFALPEMASELAAYVQWYNCHRPHSSLGGATPRELLAGAVPACKQPGIETRTSSELKPHSALPPARRVEKLQAIVTQVNGRAQLPIVELRAAA